MFGGAKHIIIAVDDEAILLSSIVSILEDYYIVKPFISGQTALKYLEKHPADLILLDYQMPGMTGNEILMKLQENEATREIPVVFLTGSVSADMEVEVLEKGAADYIVKPIRPRVLLARIRAQLELQSYRKHLEALVKEKTDNLVVAYEKLKVREDITLSMLARITDMRDHDTGSHIKRTTEYTKLIVQYLVDNPQKGYELTEYEAADIIKSAKLHDLGKIAIPDHILLKNGKLDDDEYNVIKYHSDYGAHMLDEFIIQMEDDSFLNTAREIALSHHEKWNGEGYPHGLTGEEIPLSARIAALADVYDALTSVRPYKEAYSHSTAVEIITSESGSHFDPYLVQVFLKNEKKFEVVVLNI